MFFIALHAWPPSNRPPGTGNGSHHDVLELPRRGSFVRQPAVLSTSYRRVLEASQFKANPIVVMMLLLRKSGLQIQTGTNLEHQCCVSLCIAVAHRACESSLCPCCACTGLLTGAGSGRSSSNDSQRHRASKARACRRCSLSFTAPVWRFTGES